MSSFQCPYCKEDFFSDLNANEINNVLSSITNINESLLGIKKQIENIIKNDINRNNQNNDLASQLKNITIILDNSINKNDNNSETLRNTIEILNAGSHFKDSRDDVKIFKIKGNDDWKKYITNFLLNNNTIFGNDIYNNILTKAALVGVNGRFWAYTSNFHMDPFYFEFLKKIFENGMDKKKEVILGDNKFKIVDFKKDFSIDLEEGECGGTIAKTKIGFIFGFYNSKVYYRMNGEAKKQNLELCNKVVENLALRLKSLNY